MKPTAMNGELDLETMGYMYTGTHSVRQFARENHHNGKKITHLHVHHYKCTLFSHINKSQWIFNAQKLQPN